MVNHHGASPLVLGGRPAVVTVEAEGSWVWTAWDESCALALTDDERVAKELEEGIKAHDETRESRCIRLVTDPFVILSRIRVYARSHWPG